MLRLSLLATSVCTDKTHVWGEQVHPHAYTHASGHYDQHAGTGQDMQTVAVVSDLQAELSCAEGCTIQALQHEAEEQQ